LRLVRSHHRAAGGSFGGQMEEEKNSHIRIRNREVEGWDGEQEDGRIDSGERGGGRVGMIGAGENGSVGLKNVRCW